MPAAFVQKATFDDLLSVGSPFQQTVTFPASTAAGNLIVIAISNANTAATVTAVTMTGETFTQITNVSWAGVAGRYASYYAKNLVGGQTVVTVQWDADPNGRVHITAHEVSGLDTVAPLDQHTTNTSNNSGTGTDVITTGSVTTTAAGEYIFGFLNDTGGGTPNTSPGTGFTGRDTGGIRGGESEDQVQSSSGSIAATWSETVAIGYGAEIITFKSSTAAAAVTGFAAPVLRSRMREW